MQYDDEAEDRPRSRKGHAEVPQDCEEHQEMQYQSPCYERRNTFVMRKEIDYETLSKLGFNYVVVKPDEIVDGEELMHIALFNDALDALNFANADKFEYVMYIGEKNDL